MEKLTTQLCTCILIPMFPVYVLLLNAYKVLCVVYDSITSVKRADVK